MAETKNIVVADKFTKEGAGKWGPYTTYCVREGDDNGPVYTTLKDTSFAMVPGGWDGVAKGQAYTVELEKKGNYLNIVKMWPMQGAPAQPQAEYAPGNEPTGPAPSGHPDRRDDTPNDHTPSMEECMQKAAQLAKAFGCENETSKLMLAIQMHRAGRF